MVLAILLGGIFGLLVAGGVLVAGMVRQARRDQNDMNEAFADTRGEAHDPVFGPAPWSSFDMEALGEEEDAAPVDRSDPYATLTGVAAVSWSHSSEANGADDLTPLDDEPATHLTAEPDEIFVAEPHDTFVAEPDDTFVAEPHDTFVAEPASDTFVAEPEEIVVAEPVETFVAEPEETFVAKPAAMLPESVDNGATPASIDDERTVLWRAPAQSQVIILVGRAPRTRRRPRGDDQARGTRRTWTSSRRPSPTRAVHTNAGTATDGVRPSTSTGATGPRRMRRPRRSTGATAHRTSARHRGGARQGATTVRSRSRGGRERTDRPSVARQLSLGSADPFAQAESGEDLARRRRPVQRVEVQAGRATVEERLAQPRGLGDADLAEPPPCRRRRRTACRPATCGNSEPWSSAMRVIERRLVAGMIPGSTGLSTPLARSPATRSK